MRKENNLLYYIKCHWKLNLLAILLQVLCAGISVLTNLAMIQMTQEIIERNMELFLYWMLLDFILWLIYCGADGVRAWVVSKTKMTMNNQVRADIVATMLKQSHQEFHGMHSGAHISWLTNDVNQIASLAWDPFYNIVELVASVVFSVAALAQMHWSLLTVSLFVAVIIVNAPKMFTKRVEMLSEDCAREQAEAMAKMKDLLAGVDVLRAFGRTKRFIDENRDASVQLEEPKHRQTYVQAFIGEGIDLVNLICQLSVNALIGILSIRGIIIQSALMGGGNLCGTIYGGLAGLSRQILSIRASKPYFQKITEREIREVRREWNAAMERESHG